MKRRIMQILIMVATTMTGWAQNENKFSASTLMFLSEQRGEIQLPKANEKVPLTMTSSLPFGADDIAKMKAYTKRKIADVEQVGGVDMISAFICVDNDNFSGIESLGVVVQSKFKNMIAALIPIDKIQDVAALNSVTKIEVAEVLEPVNDRQRSFTQAGDAITNSAAAQALGLTKQYTGKDVILGIIDTGVDFQHIAFKDASGNSRIVRAYKLQSSNSSSLTTYSSASQISSLTYDTNAEDHGTHTSTTAGGSSVIVNGSSVTVTNDHVNATYGGMAPEANLVIAGLSSLYTTSIGTAIQNICNYADQVGKPCVISLSLGSQVGPHDGTGTIASIVDQYAGNNHIIVYAASNDGMRANSFVDLGTSNGGGMYASGTSTSSKPMLVNVQRSFSNADGNVEMLSPTITAYARTAGVATSLKFHVVNVSTGAVVYSSDAYASSTTISVTGTTGLAKYFKSSSSYYNQYGDAGKIRIVRTQDSSNNKYYWQVYCPIMLSTSYDDSDGDGVYNSKYAFCVSVYPTSTSASTIIDMWENYASWFGTDLNLSSSSYNYCKGNDDCSVSDNACYSKVISVGAYVTRNSVTNYAGTVTDASGEYPNIGDHASFSSWQTEGYGPLGTPLPHINAPGARIIAGVNHYHTASVDDYSYYGDDYKGDLVVNSSSYPYAAMEGTSMATPCVSGIIAQWLQACVEAGKTPTPEYIKEVMAATWDTDEWTEGTGSGAHGAKTFGTHGKINAIKGIQYILGLPLANPDPQIETSLEGTVLEEPSTPIGATQTAALEVRGSNLKGDVTVTLSDENGVFSISKQTTAASARMQVKKAAADNTLTISKDEAEAGATVVVGFTPTATGNYTATLTLSTEDMDNQVITLSGTGVQPEFIADPESLTFDGTVGETSVLDLDVLGVNLAGDITATITGDEAFSLSTNTISVADAEDGATVTVTFAPTESKSYSATVTLSSPNAETATVSLTGSATPAYFDATITSVGLSTMYLDFPVTIPYDNEDLLGVYYISDTSNKAEFKLKRLASTIPPFTGVILQGNSGTYRFPKATQYSELAYENKLSGSVIAITPAEALAAANASADAVLMTLGRGSDSYINFYRYSGAMLNPYKAFLIYEGNSNARSVSVSWGDDTTTGIAPLMNVADDDSEWYTLQGVRLAKRPTRSGLYIHRGETVIVK